MNKLEYLQSISPKPTQPKQNGLFKSKLLKFSLIAAVALTVVITVVGLLSKLPQDEGDSLPRLSLRVSHLSSLVSTYNSSVSSSSLRGNAASLQTILSSMSNSLSTLSEEEPSTSVTQSEAAAFANASNTLASAKQKGNLDSAFASELASEVSSLITTLKTLQSSKSSAVADFANKHLSSLEILLPLFQSFSS